MRDTFLPFALPDIDDAEFDEIKESPMDIVNDKFKAQIADAAVKCDELAATAAKNAQALRDTLPEIDRRMAAQAKLEG